MMHEAGGRKHETRDRRQEAGGALRGQNAQSAVCIQQSSIRNAKSKIRLRADRGCGKLSVVMPP